MTKLKRVKAILLMSIILIAGAILVFVSCAPAVPAPVTAPPAEPERMPAAVLAIPNVGKPGAKVDYVGANFEPGEEVMVMLLTSRDIPDVETCISGTEEGLTIKVDELGSFSISKTLPGAPGVYTMRVYDKEGKMIASTAMVVSQM